jgi:hypothetical protein
MLEVGVNYSFFTGNPIEGRGLEQLDKSERWTGGSSEIAKVASQILSYENIGLSPIQIDYLIRGMLGMAGVAGSAMVDVTYGAVSGNRPEAKPTQIARAATVGAFVAPDMPMGWNERYYRVRDNAANAYATLNNAIKYRTGEEAQEIAASRTNELRVRPIMNKLDQMKENNRAHIKRVEQALRAGTIDRVRARELINQIQRQEQNYLAQIMPQIEAMAEGRR